MRRLARYLLTAGWIISLMLCIGVCVLWVRSPVATDTVRCTYVRWLSDGRAAGEAVEFCSDAEYIYLMAISGRARPQHGDSLHYYYFDAEEVEEPRLRLRYYQGFRPFDVAASRKIGGLNALRWESTRSAEVRSFNIGVSHWLLAVLFAVPPAVAAYRIRARRRRRRIGLCASCGYDLRASPERCPECGRGVRRCIAAGWRRRIVRRCAGHIGLRIRAFLVTLLSCEVSR